MATIKINREQLIKTLTLAVKDMEQKHKKNEDAEAAFRKERAAWGAKIVGLAVKNHKSYQTTPYPQSWNNHIRVEIFVPLGDCPPEPSMPEDWEHVSAHEIKELQQFIKMLEMGTDESISMTSLKSVAQYL